MTDAIDVVRHPRARRARLSVDPATGRVRLVVPSRAALRPMLAWAEAKRDWIDAQRARLPPPRPFADGATFPLEGGEVRICWNPAAARTPSLEDGELRVGALLASLPGRVERWVRARALAVLSAETAEHAARAGVTISRVAVGDPRTRWGSCAHDGTIRYSWRLILAPPHVRRATVAHEVAHRVHMDHSPAFHALVARLHDGDVAAARAWLRAHGASLHWVGRYSGEGAAGRS